MFSVIFCPWAPQHFETPVLPWNVHERKTACSGFLWQEVKTRLIIWSCKSLWYSYEPTCIFAEPGLTHHNSAVVNPPHGIKPVKASFLNALRVRGYGTLIEFESCRVTRCGATENGMISFCTKSPHFLFLNGWIILFDTSPQLRKLDSALTGDEQCASFKCETSGRICSGRAILTHCSLELKNVTNVTAGDNEPRQIFNRFRIYISIANNPTSVIVMETQHAPMLRVEGDVVSGRTVPFG